MKRQPEDRKRAIRPEPTLKQAVAARETLAWLGIAYDEPRLDQYITERAVDDIARNLDKVAELVGMLSLSSVEPEIWDALKRVRTSFSR